MSAAKQQSFLGLLLLLLLLGLAQSQFLALQSRLPRYGGHFAQPVPIVRHRQAAHNGCPSGSQLLLSPGGADSCTGRTSNCWSPGVRDLDCPGSGLCCFDGCVNRCQPMASAPVVAPRTSPRPINPCSPSPCGPGTICSPSPHGNPICRCEPGLIPRPDTITGCGPECTRDSDCHSGLICTDQKCIERPDPCDPSPCGPGANCMVNSLGNPICRCDPGLIPKPDTITGCGPECTRDSDCHSGQICADQKCIQRPDPCDPSPCGPGANCMVNFDGNPVCRCNPGLIPKKSTIDGCEPECTRDSDCQSDQICEDQKCIQRPDPCDPSPCGPGTNCMVNSNGHAICRCQGRLVPQPDTITGCGPECTVDRDCGSTGFVCRNQLCEEAPDPCAREPCGTSAICRARGDVDYSCSCPPGYFGNARLACTKGECESDDDCSQTESCNHYHCVNPCESDEGQVCQKDYFCRVVRHIATCGLKYVPEEPVQERDSFVIGESYSEQRPTNPSGGLNTLILTRSASRGSTTPRRGSSTPRRGSFVIGSRGELNNGSGGGAAAPRSLSIIGSSYNK